MVRTSVSLAKIDRLIHKIDFTPFSIVVDMFKAAESDYRIKVRLFHINYQAGIVEFVKANLMILDSYVYGRFYTSEKTRPVITWHSVDYANERKFVKDLEQTLKSCVDHLN